MWGLSLCYDRRSAMFSQPEDEKWGVIGEDLFNDENFYEKFMFSPEELKDLVIPIGMTGEFIINQFIDSIESPLGLTLRVLEKKLIERTNFIAETKYTLDDYVMGKGGKAILKKGTASQLDKMFADTDKINTLVQTAMNALNSDSAKDSNKGGGLASLGDSDKNY